MFKFTINFIKKHSQFFKYCVGGGIAFVVDFSFLWLLTEKFGLWYLWSASTSFVISVFVNYFIQRHWTFKSKDNRTARQISLFFTAQIVGLFINNTVMYVLVEHFSFYYLLAKAIAAGIVLIWNFWANKAFIFNARHKNDCPKIVIAGEIFPPDIGGPATYSYYLSKYLLDQGKNIHIICYSAAPPTSDDEEFGSNIQRVSSYLPLAIKYFLYFLKLCNICLHAHVIYAQGPVASGLPALLASRLFRKKLVIKIVGDYAWEQGRLLGATKENIDEWQSNRLFKSKSWRTNLKLKLIDKIQHATVNYAHVVITPSQYLKKTITGWNVDPNKIKVIYNSFFSQPYEKINRDQAKTKVKLDGDLIITVARLMNWKGIDMLIEIMPALKKINPKFKLLIAGSGPEENYLKKLITKHNLAKDVIMLGRVPRQKLTNYYLASSIFALNSSYEGLPHVALDAMYYQIPMILSDVGGNNELIQHEYNGLLATYNDKKEWIEAFRRLWQNKGMRERFCANPLTKMKVFTFENMITETLKVLE